MVHALRAASENLKRTSFEPDPAQVIVDPECVERRPLGATAWSASEGREYKDVAERDGTAEKSARPKIYLNKRRNQLAPEDLIRLP